MFYFQLLLFNSNFHVLNKFSFISFLNTRLNSSFATLSLGWLHQSFVEFSNFIFETEFQIFQISKGRRCSQPDTYKKMLLSLIPRGLDHKSMDPTFVLLDVFLLNNFLSSFWRCILRLTNPYSIAILP